MLYYNTQVPINKKWKPSLQSVTPLLNNTTDDTTDDTTQPLTHNLDP